MKRLRRAHGSRRSLSRALAALLVLGVFAGLLAPAERPAAAQSTSTLAFSEVTYLVSEGSAIRVTVGISPALAADSRVLITHSSPEGATSPEDYTVSGLDASGHLVLPAGAAQASFVVHAVADYVNDDGTFSGLNETVVFRMAAVAGEPYTVGGGSTTEVLILDDSLLWTADLTPKSVNSNAALGCDTDDTTAANKCSATATLSDDDFTLGSTTFSVSYIGLVNSSKNLFVEFDATISDELKGYTLHVGSARFLLADATITSASSLTNNTASWTSTGLSWTANTGVEMRLEPSQAPDKPKDVGVSAGDRRLNAYWQPPDDPGDSEVTGYEVQYKESSAPDRGSDVLWDATLTVDRSAQFFGCTDFSVLDACSVALDDAGFSLGGVEYTVIELDLSSSTGELVMGFSTDIGALADYSLVVGGSRFSLSPFRDFSSTSWTSSGVTWTDGQQVRLSLVTSDGTPAARGPGDGWVPVPHSGTGIRAAVLGEPEPVWEATLTPKNIRNLAAVGCENAESAAANKCTAAATLSDDDFTLGGTAFSVTRIAQYGSSRNVWVTFDNVISDTLKGSVLHVGDDEFALADATISGSGTIAMWAHADEILTAGSAVSLKLVPSGGSLVNYRGYDVRVRAVNSVGAGAWSAVVSGAPARQREVWSATLTSKAVTPAGVASGEARGCDASAAGQCAAALTDSTIDVEGGTAVDVFDLFLLNDLSCGDDSMSPCDTHNALTMTLASAGFRRDHTLVVGGVQFSFAEGFHSSLEAQWLSSGLVWSEWAAGQSVELRILKSLVTPGVPAGLAVAAGDGQLTASWSAPSDVGGSAISRYQVSYKERAAPDRLDNPTGDPADGWVSAGRVAPAGSGLSLVIAGLDNLTQYEVRVLAVNTQGAGGWSDAVRAIPLPEGTLWAAKLAVSDLGAGNFGCHWPGGAMSSLSCQNLALPVIEDNDFVLDGATYRVVTVSVNQGNLAFAISDPGPAFPAGIRAYVLQVGDAQFPFANPDVADDTNIKQWSGAPSWTVGQVVQLQIKLGTVPTGLTLETTQDAIDVSWTAPSDPDFAVVGYDVEYRRHTAPDEAATTSGDPGTGWVDTGHSGTGTAERIAGLDTYGRYVVRVRASDAEGPSFWSSPSSVRVLPADQRVVWESDLSVGEVSFGLGHGRSASALGCGAPAADVRSGPVCSSAMSAGRVAFRGSPVGVAYVNLGSGHYVHLGSSTLAHQDSGAGTLSFALESVLGEWMFLSLVVDGTVFPLLTGESYNYEAVSGRAPYLFAWPGAGLGWSAGDTADLALVYTPLLWMESTTNRPDRLGSFPMHVRETPPAGSIVDVRGKDPDEPAGAYYSLPIWISEPAPPGGLRVSLEVDPASTATAGVDYEWLNSYDPFVPADRQAKVTTAPYVFFEEGETGYHRVFLRIIDDAHEDSGETIIVKPTAEGFEGRGMVITILNHDTGAPPGAAEAAPTSLAAEKTAAEKRERDKPRRPIPGKSDNARLAGLSLRDGWVLSPAFDPDTTDYRVHHTASQASHISVLAKIRTEHPEATFAAPGHDTGIGWWSLGTGYTFHEPVALTVTVTAADGYTTTTYTLTTTTDPVPVPAVTVTPASLSITEGAAGAYTVVLDTKPAHDVTVAPASSDPAAAGISPASATFTPADWDIPRTFTVTGTADGDTHDENVTVSHRAASSDAQYDAITIDSVTVAVADTTVELPGPVTGLTLAAKPRNVTVSWQAPDTGGAPDGYIVHIKCGRNGKHRTVDAPKTTTVFRNLKPGTTCNIWARAQNDAGKGPRTHTTTTLPQQQPQPDPEQTDPEQTDPEQTDPEQTDPEQPDPEQTDPEQTDPEQPEPQQSEPEPQQPEHPGDGRLEPFNVQVVPGDGTLTVTWIVSPRAGEADDDIHHALRWSQTAGVWANPAGPRGHHNDGIVIWGGTATYTITGLTNGIATGVFVRSFTGTRTGEDSPHTSKWVRIKGPNTTPQAPGS
ncbi:fibronectin type III domain-containing protein [Candidatus Poriferisodalis sp.]|uniref:fibronectin type III domain-containing protein n=1 Tax=Candidatus Poriferisodalis sp. TaxID=3101277 RepID=UPI003B01E7F4